MYSIGRWAEADLWDDKDDDAFHRVVEQTLRVAPLCICARRCSADSAFSTGPPTKTSPK